MNNNFYQNQRQIDLGERDRLEPPEEDTLLECGCEGRCKCDSEDEGDMR